MRGLLRKIANIYKNRIIKGFPAPIPQFQQLLTCSLSILKQIPDRIKFHPYYIMLLCVKDETYNQLFTLIRYKYTFTFPQFSHSLFFFVFEYFSCSSPDPNKAHMLHWVHSSLQSIKSTGFLLLLWFSFAVYLLNFPQPRFY